MTPASPATVHHSAWANTLRHAEPLLLDKVRIALACDTPHAQALLVETLRFLHLVAYHRQKLTPSLPVDLTWHEFILFTRYYATFCQEKFGRFIHHGPGGRADENRRNFEKTIRYYRQAWGTPPADVWGEAAVMLSEEPPCGSCLSHPG